MKTSSILLALCAMMLLSGCVTYPKCVAKYGMQSEPITITIRDTIPVPVEIEVPVPGDSVQGRLQLDSLLLAATAQGITIASESGRMEIKFWKDKYNNYLHWSARLAPDTLRVETIVEVPVEVEVECPPVTVLDKPVPWYVRLWESYKLFAAWALLVLLMILYMNDKQKDKE